MKKVLLLVVLLFGFFTQAQIVNIPDANLKAVLLQSADYIHYAYSGGQMVAIDQNSNGEIEMSEASVIDSLYVLSNNVASLDGLEAFTSLKALSFPFNDVSEIELTSFPGLLKLECFGNPISNLNLSATPNLRNLAVDECPLTQLDLSFVPLLHTLSIGNPELSVLDLSGCPDLRTLGVNLPFFSSQHLAQVPNLQLLNCHNSAELDLSLVPNLKWLGLLNYHFDSIALESLVNLIRFNCIDSDVITLDMSHCVSLTGTQISHCPALTSIFMKNGGSITNPVIYGNMLLEVICTNAQNIANTQLQFDNIFPNPDNVMITSYCDIGPGGNFNTISGTVRFAADLQNCSSGDVTSYVGMNISDGMESYGTTTNATGNYAFYTDAGAFTLHPFLENPGYFNVNPVNSEVNFPSADNLSATHDFCLTPNGVHPDVEVVASCQWVAPGFDADYSILVRNKGNQTVSASPGLVFTFDTNQLDYVSSAPTASAASAGLVTWNYSGLAPFETRVYHVTMNVHPPTHASPVNTGDVVAVEASVTAAGDVMPADNTFSFSNIAVNSFDPNDITCLEGAMEHTSKIGDYLHYRVRFENTGTAAAQNIVVRMPINAAMYHTNSLQMLHASHGVEVRIQDNIAEFFFMGIQLQPEAHGDFLFKMKTLGTLENGDSVTSSAGIYFDYNFPILTNEAETVFNDLSVSDSPAFEASVFPNPADNELYINSKSAVDKAEIFDVAGRLLSVHQVGIELNIPVSGLPAGNYFIRLHTQSGIGTIKFIKK